MKQLFFPLALVVLLLSACSKDPEETPLNLPGEYEAGYTLTTGPIAMYTKNGMVNDVALIDRFLSRRTWSNSYFSRSDTPVPNSSSLKLLIAATNQATFITTSAGRSDTLMAEVTNQLAKYAICTLRDSVSNSSSINLAHCDLLAGKIEAEYPVKRCNPTGYIAGTFYQTCKFRPVRLLKIDAGKLFVPQLSWLIQTGPPQTSICGLAYSGQWNVFNPAILNQLIDGDTVVVQERQIALTKK